MNAAYTREWWKERMHLIQAFVDGKLILFDNERPTTGNFIEHPSRYTIVEPPALVPWTMDDVPLNCWVRNKGSDQWWNIEEIHATGVQVRSTFLPFHYMIRSMEHTIDGKTWHPCGKEGGNK